MAMKSAVLMVAAPTAAASVVTVLLRTRKNSRGDGGLYSGLWAIYYIYLYQCIWLFLGVLSRFLGTLWCHTFSPLLCAGGRALEALS